MSDSPSTNRRLWHVRKSPRELHRSMRIAALVGAGIVVIYLIAALFAPYFLDMDRYRPDISASLSEQTGRQVTLGTIRARIIPNVGFTIDALHMGNPPGFAPGQFISAEGIRGTLAFGPLVLRRELHVKSLELIQPRLWLLQDEDGKNNYTFSPEPSSAAGATPNREEKNGAPPQANAPRLVPGTSVLQIDQVILRGARVIFGTIDARGQIAATVDASRLDVNLRHLMLQPVRVRDWRVDAKLNGTRFTLAGWDSPITFLSGTAMLRDAALQSNFLADFGKAARINGTFSIADVEHAVVKFDLKTHDVDLDALLAAATAKPASVAPAAASAKSLPRDSEKFVASARDRTMKLRGTESSTVPPAIPPPGVSPSPPGGSELLAEGHLAAERIRTGPQIGGPATADLRIYSDRVEIWPVTARFDDGSLQFSARTDRRQTPQRFSINVQIRNLNVSRIVVTSPALRDKLAGTGELDLQAFGSLTDAWTKSLVGKGQFAIHNGRISGFSLAGAAQSISRDYSGPPAAADSARHAESSDTTFTAIKGDIAVDGERIASSDLHLDSSRGTADLRGSIGFDGSLGYEGQIIVPLAPGETSVATGAATGAPPAGAHGKQAKNMALKLSIQNGKLTVPFALHGSLQSPEILPSHNVVNFSATDGSLQPADSSFPNLFKK